jgi:hypothetical protein
MSPIAFNGEGGVVMKRTVTLIVVTVVLLFSQWALAEVEFQLGEPLVFRVDGVQDQGLPDQELAAAGLKIVPLQALTHVDFTNIRPYPWLAVNEEFCMSVFFRVYGSGYGTVIITVTDTKTGKSGKYKTTRLFEENIVGLGWGPDAFISAPSALPRRYDIKFSFKVGTIVKSVDTYVLIE